MRNPFRKIFDMTEKEPNTPDTDTPETMPDPAVSAENASQGAPDTTPDQERIRELQQQLDESRSKYMYLYSDMENIRRNAARERMELISTAGRDIMAALLPVLDDFDRAAKNDGLSDGMTLIHQKLANTLKSKGLQPLETQPGDPFDADRHEAIVEIPAPSEDLKGKIVDIIEQGYTLGERIIRYAKVVVGK
jgi:molecular chaperone GrpE